MGKSPFLYLLLMPAELLLALSELPPEPRGMEDTADLDF